MLQLKRLWKIPESFFRTVHKAPHHKHKVVVHRPAPPPKHHKKDNSGKVVGGIILGAILGAVIANNN